DHFVEHAERAVVSAVFARQKPAGLNVGAVVEQIGADGLVDGGNEVLALHVYRAVLACQLQIVDLKVVRGDAARIDEKRRSLGDGSTGRRVANKELRNGPRLVERGAGVIIVFRNAAVVEPGANVQQVAPVADSVIEGQMGDARSVGISAAV